VVQILAREVDLRAAERVRDPGREVKRRGAADVVAEQRKQLRVEARVGRAFQIGVLEFVERRDERFRDILASEGAEIH